jgi:Flp pilus assembly protein TadD
MKLYQYAVVASLAFSLAGCVEAQLQTQSPEQALRECQASNPHSEEQQYQEHVEYERECYAKYNETKPDAAAQ